MTADPETPFAGRRLDAAAIGALPTLADLGFDGGRNAFRTFCRAVFPGPAPRFLRTEDGALVVYRHADLRALGAMEEIGDVPPAVLFPQAYAERGEAEPAAGLAIARVISNQVFTANPPIHGPVRRILLNQLGPRQVEDFDPLIDAVLSGIVAELPASGEIDVVADIGERLTSRFWGALIGLTRAETDRVAASIREVTPLFHIARTEAQLRRVDAAFADYEAAIEAGARRSLEEGRHPFVTGLAEDLAAVDLEDDPALAGIVPKSVGAFLSGNLFDGFHTAALAAANAAYALMKNRDALRQALEDPTLIDAAVAESLRLEPPVLMLKRYALADARFDDVVIPRGAVVAMFWAAGNHDPDAFEDPDTFSLSRRRQGLTTFGAGAHICPGRHVAGALLRRFVEIIGPILGRSQVAAPDAGWIGNHLMCQLGELRLRPADAGA